jgi:hypothetical protein
MCRVLAQAKWNETAGHACQLPCQCPADGGRCTLASACAEGTFACKPGFERFTDKQLKCFKAGCQDGSLQARTAGRF